MNSFRKRVTLLILLLLVPLSLGGLAAASNGADAHDDATVSASSTLFLPVVTRLGPNTDTVLGAELSRNAAASTGQRTNEARLAWMRYNGIVWSEVEASRGNRDWSRLAGVEAELRMISEQGARPIVIVRGTPGWAQKVAGYSCGPIKPEALSDFASFMAELVSRYSRPPYNVKHWELGNEPEIPPHLAEPHSQYGCWGDDNDPYGGGGGYAEMLKAVYPAIKAADPEAKVIVGGLILDCDPERAPAGTCKRGNFLEGILRNGGGAAFDILAYHAYTGVDARRHDWDRDNSVWQPRGGVLLGKLQFLRSVMARYNVSKPIMMNEGGLLCWQAEPCSAEARSFQANYAVRLFARARANQLTAAIWYTLDGPGWYDGGLLDGAQNPRPAFGTIKFITGKLAGAEYLGSNGNGISEEFAFRSNGRIIRIFWTNDGSTAPLAQPGGTRAVYNMYGQLIAFPGVVSFDPIFVESDS